MKKMLFVLCAVLSILTAVLVTSSLNKSPDIKEDNIQQLTNEEMLEQNPKDKAKVYIAYKNRYTTDKYILDTEEIQGGYIVSVTDKKNGTLIEKVEVSIDEINNFKLNSTEKTQIKSKTVTATKVEKSSNQE